MRLIDGKDSLDLVLVTLFIEQRILDDALLRLHTTPTIRAVFREQKCKTNHSQPIVPDQYAVLAVQRQSNRRGKLKFVCKFQCYGENRHEL